MTILVLMTNFWKITSLTLQVSENDINGPRFCKLENYAIMVLVLMFNCRFGPYEKFGKVTFQAPKVSEFTKWTLCF